MLAPVPTQHPLQFQHPADPLFLPSLPSSCFWQYKLKEEILVSHGEELQKEKSDVCNRLATSFVHFYMSVQNLRVWRTRGTLASGHDAVTVVLSAEQLWLPAQGWT